jgi:hypothetical protein
MPRLRGLTLRRLAEAKSGPPAGNPAGQRWKLAGEPTPVERRLGALGEANWLAFPRRVWATFAAAPAQTPRVNDQTPSSSRRRRPTRCLHRPERSGVWSRNWRRLGAEEELPWTWTSWETLVDWTEPRELAERALAVEPSTERAAAVALWKREERVAVAPSWRG